MRIAVAQTPGVRLEQWRETLALVNDLVRQAAGLRAQLVVLPECAWPAYCLGTRHAYDGARANGLPEPDAFLQTLRQTARQQHIAICTGHVAEHTRQLYNAASVIDADGRLLGTRYKCFLWAFDHDYFEPGDRIEPLDTAWGRTGVMICADARLPEIPATLAARGVELILQPTAWVNSGTPTVLWNPQPDFLIAARAAEFRVPIASASKWGVEGDTTFVGGSLICDASGNVLAQAGPNETTVIAAEVELAPARRPVLTDMERAVLQSESSPPRPRTDVGPLEIVLLPPESDAPADRAPLLTAGAHSRLIIQPGSTHIMEHITQRADDRVAFLTGPMPGALDLGGVRIGAIAATDAARFAAVRCLALGGAHLVIAFGRDASLGLLRSRACENRVFILHVNDQGWCAINPSGEGPQLSTPSARPVTLTLNAAQAANKLVAPRTDVLVGRQPGQYEF